MITRSFLSQKEKFEARQIIYEKTGYWLVGSSIINQIFRRSSLTAETGQQSNEIFEFIGDQVISSYVVKTITKRCGSLSLTGDYAFRIRENQFTQIKQSLVNNEAFAKIIDEWGIAKYLLLGKSDIKNDVLKGTKIKADLFEAIIGAIAIACDWQDEILETAVLKSLDIDARISDMIESDIKIQNVDINNAVTLLKELAEKGQFGMPKYAFSGPEYIGYNSDGSPRWMCTCCFVNDRIGITRLVEASSKKDAKKAAAYLVLCEHFEMQNKYGPNDCFGDWIYKNGNLFPNRNQINF